MYSSLPRPFFILAPMDEVTDTVFRQVVAGLAMPDLFFTEFVNVDGLYSNGRESSLKRLRHSAAEKPLVAQIWGVEPENYRRAAKDLVDMGFAGIDINMGCPDKTIIKRGCCGGLINNRDKAVEIIQAVQDGAAGRLPVSVKTRLGSGTIDYTWHELLLAQNLAMLTLHGRVVRQMSRGEADWEAIGQVAALRDRIAPQTLITGNGDVQNRAQGAALATQYGLDGIMIGRGVFHDPFVFAPESPWAGYSPAQRLELYINHVRLFAKTWQNGERQVATLNKFCKVYISGFDGASAMRERLMGAGSTDELLQILADYAQALRPA